MSFSDFICIFAMSFRVLFVVAALRSVKFLTCQNPEQLFVDQVLIKKY